MASKRKYSYTRCANPDCEHPYFEPTDKRQRFCSSQCRFNYHNDRRSKRQKNIKSWIEDIDRSDLMVETAYLHLDFKANPITEDWLQLLKIDLSVAKREKSMKSGKEVLWFNRYGLQKLDKKEKKFKILCRNNI